MTRWLYPSVAFVGSLAFIAAYGCSDDETPGQTPTSSSGKTTGASMGGSGPSSSTTTTASSMGGQGSGGTPDTYPPGPYGIEVGDTFPFLTWQGYINADPAALANTAPWTDTWTSENVRTSGAPFALIHTALSG
jgi:hypothetical protein